MEFVQATMGNEGCLLTRFVVYLDLPKSRARSRVVKKQELPCWSNRSAKQDRANRSALVMALREW